MMLIDSNIFYKTLRVIIMALTVSIVASFFSGCTTSVSDAQHESIIQPYTFPAYPYEITSVNLSNDSTLLLGTTSNHFLIYDPNTCIVKEVALPPELNNAKTYYINQLSNGAYIVSKRNHGIAYIPNDSSENIKIIYQDSCGIPIKHNKYSSYISESIVSDGRLSDSILIGTTNGLMYASLNSLSTDTSKIFRSHFVESLRKKRDSIPQFPIQSIRLRDDTIYVFTDSKTLAIDGLFDTIPLPVGVRNGSKHEYYVDSLKEPWTNAMYDKLAIDKDNAQGAVELGDKLYFVSGGRFNSVDVAQFRAMDNTPTYFRLSFCAQGDDDLFFANTSGLYRANADSVTFINLIDIEDKPISAVCHEDKIYYITENKFNVITPHSKYLPWAITPNVLKEIVSNHGDKLTCLGMNDNSLYFGSRDSIYRYDLNSQKIENLKGLNNGKDDFQNPYFTSISYPYVGTLNRGLFFIEGDSIKRLEEPKNDSIPEIAKTIYCPPYLWALTNEGLFRFKADGAKIQSVDTVNLQIKDIASLNDKIYILTDDRLYSSPIDTVQIDFISENNFYTALATVDSTLIAYNNACNLGVFSNGKMNHKSPWDFDGVQWHVLILVVLSILLFAGFCGLAVYAKRKKAELMRKKQEVEVQLENTRRELSTTETKLTQKQDELNLLNQRHDDVERQLAETSEMLKKLSQEKIALEDQLTTTQALLAVTTSDLKNVRAEKEVVERELSSTRQDLSATKIALDKVKSDVANVEQELRTYQEKLTLKQNELKDLNHRFEDAQRQLAATQEELADASKEHEKLMLEKKQLEGQLATTQVLLTETQSYLEVIRTKKQEVEDELKKTRTDLSAAETALNKVKTDKYNVEQDLQMHREELIQKQDELNLLNQRYDDAERQLKEAQDEMASAREELTKVKQDYDFYKCYNIIQELSIDRLKDSGDYSCSYPNPHKKFISLFARLKDNTSDRETYKADFSTLLQYARDIIVGAMKIMPDLKTADTQLSTYLGKGDDGVFDLLRNLLRYIEDRMRYLRERGHSRSQSEILNDAITIISIYDNIIAEIRMVLQPNVFDQEVKRMVGIAASVKDMSVSSSELTLSAFDEKLLSYRKRVLSFFTGKRGSIFLDKTHAMIKNGEMTSKGEDKRKYNINATGLVLFSSLSADEINRFLISRFNEGLNRPEKGKHVGKNQTYNTFKNIVPENFEIPQKIFDIIFLAVMPQNKLIEQMIDIKLSTDK